MIAAPVTLPIKAGPVPDQVSIWPMDDGRYGFDAIFEGPSGCERAHTHERELNTLGVPHSFRLESSGAWTLRFGPLSAHDLTCAMDSFVY